MLKNYSTFKYIALSDIVTQALCSAVHCVEGHPGILHTVHSMHTAYYRNNIV